MNEDNILNFITHATMGGINAINAGLQTQANALANIAKNQVAATRSAQTLTRALEQQKNRIAELNRLNAGGSMILPNSRLRGANGQFVTQAQYLQAFRNAVTFRNRINDVLSTIGNVKIPNLLAGLQQQLAAAPGQIRSVMASIQQAIVSKISFAGLARALIASVTVAARAIAPMISNAARQAGQAVRTFLGGALTAAHKAAQGVASALNNVKRAGTGLAIGGALAVIGGVKAAATVDQALAKINTIARATDDMLDDVARGLNKISSTTGTNFSDISAGFYDLLSAGLGMKDGVLQINDAMKLMQDASNLAVGGIGSVTDSVDFLTSLLNSFRGPLTAEFGDPLKASTAVADAFAKAVEIGKVTVSELGATFSTVAPLAAQLGLDFRETAAVVAVMTQQGFDAGESFTALRSGLVGTQRDAKRLQAALKDPFVSSELAKVGAKGWLEYLDIAGFQKFAETIRTYSEKSGVPLIKLLGRVEAVQAILGTTGAQAENYADALDQITNANGNAAEQAALLNDNLLTQLTLFGNALFAMGDALFRRRLVDPLKDFVRFLRQGVIAITDFIHESKGLFDIVVPIATLVSVMAALTAGAEAVSQIFLRMPGPISGFAFGITGIARGIALILGPIGLVAVLLNTMSQGIQQGLLPAEQFIPILQGIATAFGAIARIGAATAQAVADVVGVISSTAFLAIPFRIGDIFSELAKDVTANLDLATAGVHEIIDAIALAIATGLPDGLERRAGMIADAIMEGLGKAFQYLGPRISDTLGQVLTFGAEVITNAVELGARIVDGIAQGIIAALPGIGDAIASLPEALAGAGAEGGLIDTAIQMGKQWVDSFLGWWEENSGPIADGVIGVLTSVFDTVGRVLPGIIGGALNFIGEVLGNIVGTVEEHAPGLIAAFTDWARDVGPKILGFLGDVVNNIVTLLSEIVGRVGPPLAEAAGKFIDWIAVDVIPNVGAAVATFIDELVRNIVPLGEDGGDLDNAFGNAGDVLLTWISDRIPGTIDTLISWALAIEGWIVGTFLPRVGLVLLGVGATMLKSLFDGFMEDPVGQIARVAGGIGAILGGIVIITAVMKAGTLAGAAWSGAFKAAAWLGNSLLGGVGGAFKGFTKVLVEEATASGTLAGTAGFAAMAAAFAIPITAIVLVLLKVAADVQASKDTFAGQVQDVVETGSITNLVNARDAIQAHIDSSKLFGVIPIQIAGEVDEMERQIDVINADINRLAHTGPGIKLPVNLEMLGPPVPADWDPVFAALEGGVKDAYREFKNGTTDIVTEWNTLPDRMKSQQELLREALKKPFDLKDAAAGFKESFRLITEAQASGNVEAIIQSNALRTSMVADAETINAAFIAAGEAPPFFVDALTGQVTLATTAGTDLVTGATDPLKNVPGAMTTAGNSSSKFTAGIRAEIDDAGGAGRALYGAGMNPLKTTHSRLAQLFSWGRGLADSWVDGIIKELNDSAEDPDLFSAVAHVGSFMKSTSPPKVGPLKNIDHWGESIGKTWVDGIVTGLEDGPTKVGRAMAGVANTLSGGIGATVGLAYATGDGRVSAGALAPLASGRGAGYDAKPQASVEGERAVAVLETISSQLSLHSQLLARNVATDPRAAGALPAINELARMKNQMSGG